MFRLLYHVLHVSQSHEKLRDPCWCGALMVAVFQRENENRRNGQWNLESCAWINPILRSSAILEYEYYVEESRIWFLKSCIKIYLCMCIVFLSIALSFIQ